MNKCVLSVILSAGLASPALAGQGHCAGSDQAQIGQLIARFKAAIIAHDQQGLEALFVPDGGSWFEVLGEDAFDRFQARKPDHAALHAGGQLHLLRESLQRLVGRLDPAQFIRIHRSTILRRDCIRGLRHDGLGVWSIELDDGEALRIGRTYLNKVKAMAGR